MKPDKQIHFKFECMGSPSDSVKSSNSVLGFLKELSYWLLRVSLQRRIVITIGRDESDITESNKTQSAKNDALADLEKLFDELANQPCAPDFIDES